MNPDSENFEALRRLLALKRHEQPLPGYFNRFSRDVMARIRAGESGGEMALQLPWFQRVLAMFDVKPAFAGVFGMAVCGLLISGVIATESPTASVPSPVVVDGQSPTTPITPVPVSFVSGNSNAVASSPSLFDQFQPQVNAQPASYWVPAGN